MKITSFALIALLAAPLVASADDNKPTTTTTDKAKATDKTTTGKLADSDLQVMSQMHHVNQMEIDMGKLAQTKGSTPAVKAYGQTLVRDHTSADKDMMAFAKKNKTMIPAFKPTDEADQKDMKDDKDMAAHIKTLKGADFDKEFLSMMVTGHEKVLAKLDSAMGTIQNDDLKTMLGNIKPTLQKHADTARDLQKSNPQAMK